MKSSKQTLIRLMILVAMVSAGGNLGYAQESAAPGWKAVENALGRKGSAQPGDVYKFGMPRSDLKVAVACLNKHCRDSALALLDVAGLWRRPHI